MDTPDIIIAADGEVSFIYADGLAALLDAGDGTIMRASHVEPASTYPGFGSNGWVADMAPSGGPVLGPFDSRAEALAVEVAWLQENKGL